MIEIVVSSHLREWITGKEGLFIHSFDHHFLSIAICYQDTFFDGFDADIDSRRDHDLITLGWIEVMHEITAFSQVEQIAAFSALEVIISSTTNVL